MGKEDSINGKNISGVAHLQSEMGVVGDPSPNAEFIISTNKLIGETFKANKENDKTAKDCYLGFSQMYVGHKVNDEDIAGLAVNTTIVGNAGELRRAVTNMLLSDERLLKVMSMAVVEALARKFGPKKGKQKDEGPQDEVLRKLMGFDKDENSEDDGE